MRYNICMTIHTHMKSLVLRHVCEHSDRDDNDNTIIPEDELIILVSAMEEV
jgi:hypothetical protein